MISAIGSDVATWHPAGRDPVGVGNRELASAAASVRLGCVRERGGEEAVGPVLGVAACVGEDDRDAGVADLESGELVGEPVAVYMLELEQRAVPGFDDDRGEREFGESLELEGEGAVGERAGEVVEALAFYGGEQSPVGRVDCVVAGGNGRAHGPCALVGEAVGVALAGV